MAAADAGFKIAARVSGRPLASVAGVRSDAWVPVVSEVQTTERLADRVFRPRHGSERFLVYMEAYTYWKASAPWSVLAKSGLLSQRERLPTVSLVYILRPPGYRPQHGSFRLVAQGRSTQHVRFHEICLWQMQPKPWWVMWLPYCVHDWSSPHGQLARHGEPGALATGVFVSPAVRASMPKCSAASATKR